ncbi:MarR family winged helix-turn-helix transcriptional regulator [Streptacidiphilus alkalitolerans]|uniref:MarR family winged helix-turn-helix transcriptional regulator n=1 Tax=Streptacidiphilus alkalitolerans TaxID=3342712 RepID=UPI0036D41391
MFDDLVRFETELWNGIDARLQRDCGVPLGSFNTLLVIEATPSCRVNDIVAALSITVGGASQAVDRLEKRGLCVRRPHPTDRRSSIVELTGAGQDLVNTAGPVFDQELEAWLRGPLTDAALGRFGAALASLRAGTSRASVSVDTPAAADTADSSEGP